MAAKEKSLAAIDLTARCQGVWSGPPGSYSGLAQSVDICAVRAHTTVPNLVERPFRRQSDIRPNGTPQTALAHCRCGQS